MELKVLVDASKKESEKENHSIYVDDPNIDLECCAYLQILLFHLSLLLRNIQNYFRLLLWSALLYFRKST